MTRVFWLGAVTLVCAASALGQAPELERMDIVLKAVPNGPVARVNSAMIDAEEFKDLYIGELNRFARLNAGGEIPDKIRIGIAFTSMRLLIQQQLLRQEAEKRQLTIPDDELMARWERELKGLQKVVGREKDELPTEEEVLKTVGATREEALAELRDALILDKMRNLLIQERGVTVTDDEVAEWYEANKTRARRPDMCHLKQIFIRAPRGRTATPAPREAARQAADDALKRIRSGQSFEAVAKAVSQHPASIKEQGGDIGTGAVSELPQPLQEVVYQMNPGQVSDVIETPVGFYIMKLEEFIPGEDLSLEQTDAQIRQLLLAKKGTSAVRAFCGEILEADADLQIYLDLEKQLIARPDLIAEFTDGLSGDAEPGLETADVPDLTAQDDQEGREAP
jgi:parvulin-like peptidyl-prolyl isomerase